MINMNDIKEIIRPGISRIAQLGLSCSGKEMIWYSATSMSCTDIVSKNML